MSEPAYEHDCKVCKYITSGGRRQKYDVYFCPPNPHGAGSPGSGSFVIRYGKETHEYFSQPLFMIVATLLGQDLDSEKH